MNRNDIEKSIASMTIPRGLNQDEMFTLFTKLYHDFNCDVNTLREIVQKRVMKEQDKVLDQNRRDLLAGKYSSYEDMRNRMPLFRDGNVMKNIPDSILGWYSFMAWLNSLAFGEITV